MNVSEVIIQNLESNGIEWIFGIPGEENLHIIEAIRKSKIDFVPTRDERSAAFIAANVGRLTSKPGVVLSTVGPGATNLITGVAYAQHGGMPMIAITAQKSMLEDHQGKFQVLDIVSIINKVSKDSVQLSDPNLTPFTIANLFKRSLIGRPGAVHLEVPEDVSAMHVDSDIFIPLTDYRNGAANHSLIKRVQNLIKESHNPLIMIGAGANRKGVSRSLDQFVNQNGIYFFNTQMGKGVLSEDSPYYIGCAETSQSEKIKRAIKQSDLLLVVGHDIYEKSPSIEGNIYKKVVNINSYPSSIDHTYIADIDLVGDIGISLGKLAKGLNKKEYLDDLFYQLAKVDKLSNFSDEDEGVKELALRLRGILEEDAILCLDNGQYKLAFAKHYNVYYPQTFLLDNALATMGAGVPSAIAAKLVKPDQSVISIVGDGGFMMSIGELETANRLGLDLTIIVLTDGEFGMIEKKQRALDLTKYGVSFNKVALKKIVKGFGADYYRLSSLQDLGYAMNSNRSGVKVIEFEVEY